MSKQGNENNRESELIDITEILNDYLRIIRRMWVWVLIFAMVLRLSEVSSPRSIITGLIPSSRSRNAPNNPAGPEPTIITVFEPPAFFQTGSEFSFSDSFSSFPKTLYRMWNFNCPWRASMDFLTSSIFEKFSGRFFFESSFLTSLFISEVSASCSGRIVIVI